jgi:predicted ferric reductase
MSGIKGKSGWIAFAFLAVMPIVFWSYMGPLDVRFAAFMTTLTSLGQISALLGMSVFSLNLVLSARFKFLEGYFNGLNRMYVNHHVIGGIAFVLLMFHPLVLAIRYVPSSLRLAALFLLPGGELSNNLGMIALWSMMALLVITFFVRLPYQRWKLTHKFLSVAFLFGFLHMFLIPSDVSASLPLRYYMFSLAGIGFLSIAYRVIFSPVVVRRLDYTIDEIKPMGGGITEITLKTTGKSMKFGPGQFVFISFRDPGVSREFHPFTISSPPSESGLRLSIKSLGDYTEKLKGLKEGSAAKIEGPFGRFSYKNYANKSQVWIAGGIGITPFLSMARSLKGDEGYSIDIYYCVKSENEAVFLKELQDIASRNKDLNVILSCSDRDGRINAGMIEKSSRVTEGRVVFICGPPPMMASLKKQFISLGVPKKDVITEEFAL